MNERIRELLKQSTNPPWDGEQGPMNEFNLERFAELIVRECDKYVAERWDVCERGWWNGDLLKHFGVKE